MDMTVNVNGTTALAERACRMVFGENADLGPVIPAPQALLDMLKDWPGRGDDIHDVALELPPTAFEIDKAGQVGKRKAVLLRVNRITVLCRGRKVGYAIRTTEAGIEGLKLYAAQWATFNGQLRQAH